MLAALLDLTTLFLYSPSIERESPLPPLPEIQTLQILFTP